MPCPGLLELSITRRKYARSQQLCADHADVQNIHGLIHYICSSFMAWMKQLPSAGESWCREPGLMPETQLLATRPC